jgi:hypothetical protein
VDPGSGVSELRFRPASMVERVGLEAGRLLPAGETVRVQAALRVALARRDPQLEDDHDSRLLHPGRTVLILLRDAHCRSADVLAAAAFIDSVDTGLRASLSLLRQAAGDAAFGLASAVPAPDAGESEGLLERLVCADTEPALIALAERLDQVRHLHLRPELPWQRLHAEVLAAWLPAAQRLSPPLARRFDRWAEAFGRRLVLPSARR